MSVIRLSRCHQLNQAAQEAALEQLAAHLGDTLGASVARAARTIQFDGSGFSGTVTLEDERVVGEVRLGLMMRPSYLRLLLISTAAAANSPRRHFNVGL